MFADARTTSSGAEIETDLCIVGSGPAGVSLAREMDGRSVRVLVLESGGLSLEGPTQSLYAGPLVGLPYFPLDTARLRFFGGTSNHWGGLCRPFEPSDFETRPWVPYSGWPIRRADLEPYYGRSARFLGLPSAHWDLGYWVKKDEFAPLPLSVDTLVTRVAEQVGASQRSVGVVYREELRRSKNVTVLFQGNLTEFETDPDGKRVVRARVATLSGRRFSVSARVFVLATGGIENARMLLLSNRRLPAGLGNGNGLVGRFFLEHPRFSAGQVVPSSTEVSTGFYRAHHVAGVTIQAYLGFTDRAHERERSTDVQLRLDPVYTASFEESLSSADVASFQALTHAHFSGFGTSVKNVVSDVMTWEQFAIPGAPIPIPYPEVARRLARSNRRDLITLLPRLLGDVAGYLYSKVATPPVARLDVVTRFEPVPNPDSRVSLARQRDALGLRRAQLDWRLTRTDRHNVRRALEILGAQVGRAGIGRLRITFDEDEASWPEDLAGGWHHMGTTRMSDDPKRGVVDRNSRVHGLDNLYVAGSSVFPTAGSGTPTLTLVALSLRLADHLRGILS